MIENYLSSPHPLIVLFFFRRASFSRFCFATSSKSQLNSLFSFRFQKDVFLRDIKFKLFDLPVHEELLFFTADHKYVRYFKAPA